MNTIGIAVAIGIAGLVAVSGFSYVTYANLGNRLERQIVATDENNRNILAQFGNKVAEAAQVPDMYRDDLVKVTNAAIQGRYGADGSKAVFQMLKEQNPNLDPTLYVQLQRIIESGRNEFSAAQTKLVDQKMIYETSLGNVWGGFWMGLAGYPKIDLDKYQIVSTDRANNAFESGVEAPIKLR